jgi:trehalose monomycolate/heme transporter
VDIRRRPWLVVPELHATPLTAPVVGLIIAVIFGLSTDYEVFLVSRMVEARARGMTTEGAIRTGTATTGRLISAAALVLVVVGGAFAFSDLVMMQYLAIGLMTALLLDATVVRMFLVPSIMKVLGNDCWWAPRWMKRLQERIGLAEFDASDERKPLGAPAPLEDELIFGTVVTAGWPAAAHDAIPAKASTLSAEMTRPMATAVIDRDGDNEKPSTTETSTATGTLTNTNGDETTSTEPADEAELSPTARDDGSLR